MIFCNSAPPLIPQWNVLRRVPAAKIPKERKKRKYDLHQAFHSLKRKGVGGAFVAGETLDGKTYREMLADPTAKQNLEAEAARMEACDGDNH